MTQIQKRRRRRTCSGYELFKEALAEDLREGGTFDAIGFGQFFPECNPETVRDAWQYYKDHHYNRGLIIE